MTRTKIGLLVVFALALTPTTQGANAASPNSVISSLKDSTLEAVLVQKVHIVAGTKFHFICANGHHWLKRKRADGTWQWVYYSPCYIDP